MFLSLHDILHEKSLRLFITGKGEIQTVYENMPVLKIGKYKPRFPLIQGGMGVDISGPNLAGHVAKNGAIGTIASVGIAHNSPLFQIDKHN